MCHFIAVPLYMYAKIYMYATMHTTVDIYLDTL